MDSQNNQIKYSPNFATNFTDEIIIGSAQRTINNSDLQILPLSKTKKKNLNDVNYLLNFSILSLSIVALVLVFSKISSTAFINFNDLLASFFVGGYFSLFVLSIFLISKRKMLTLEVREGVLQIKSFPLLNKKIPINQILKCELNTLENGNFNYSNKIHFSLNEDGNRYKQPLNSGISLQLINGKHIIIGSKKE